MISAKFLGRRGGTTDNAVAALNYLLDLKNRYNLTMVATSNSWGGGGYSQVRNKQLPRISLHIACEDADVGLSLERLTVYMC
jgi:hypothetical protein